MTWREIEDSIYRAKKSLPHLDDSRLAGLELEAALHISDTCAAMEKTLPSVEASVRAYVRSRQWPVMTSEERLFLQWRTEAAEVLARTLKAVDVDFDIREQIPNEENLLEWALVSTWEEYGLPATLHMLEILARGFAAGIQSDSRGRN